MPIPKESVDRMMVKCGRRCCICRRFRPTKLQVHHIVEQAKGGSDDDDNLIVTCLSCHTDIHTKVPFARRFSVAELKGHREALIVLVASNGLPKNDSDDTDEAIARITGLLRHSTRPTTTGLLPEALEVLLKAVNGGMQGYVHFIRHDGGIALLAGGTQIPTEDRRAQAKYKAAFEQLIQVGLLDQVSKGMFEINYDGYLIADELAVSAGNSSP